MNIKSQRRVIKSELGLWTGSFKRTVRLNRFNQINLTDTHFIIVIINTTTNNNCIIIITIITISSFWYWFVCLLFLIITSGTPKYPASAYPKIDQHISLSPCIPYGDQQHKVVNMRFIFPLLPVTRFLRS